MIEGYYPQQHTRSPNTGGHFSRTRVSRRTAPRDKYECVLKIKLLPRYGAAAGFILWSCLTQSGLEQRTAAFVPG